MPRTSQLGRNRSLLKRDLVAQDVGDELVVYDRETHRAHSLNRTAARVFRGLEEKKDLRQIARTAGGPAYSSAVVVAAAHELKNAGLLARDASLPRRVALRGIATALLPVVASIVVPPSAAAQSCVPDFGVCAVTSDCCTGLFCVDVGSIEPDFRCQFAR